MNSGTAEPYRVLIAGGGVAGLEAALALRELAGGRVATTILSPTDHFVYRPMRVVEPFAYPEARRYPLEEIAHDADAELRRDAFKWLAREERIVHTQGGQQLIYDALLLALGARLQKRFEHAVTIDDRRLDEQLHGLIQDVEGGYARKLAFLIPTAMPWPLPIYELALMTARRAYDMNTEVSITLVTPEDAPLAIFGQSASQTVERLLEQHGILTIPSAHCETPAAGEVAIHPGRRSLYVDRVIALPELYGPSVPGVPIHDSHGFIHVDVHCKVQGLEHGYAAGDATSFPVKHGGLAAQQADIAAEAIAADAGALVELHKFNPVIHGMLLGAEKPLYLSAHITGEHGSASEVSESPTWSPPTKIAAKYLAPYLESRDQKTRQEESRDQTRVPPKRIDHRVGSIPT